MGACVMTSNRAGPPVRCHRGHGDSGSARDGAPDMGSDELGLVIQAGNWANGSNSHNKPGFMHPTGTGAPTRYFILPRNAGGVALDSGSRYLRLHDTIVTPVGTSTGNGWIQPPGALANPPKLASLPLGYRTKYVSFASTATADLALGSQVTTWAPLANLTGQVPLRFMVLSLLDDECSTGTCSHDYYNLQGVIVDSPSSTTEVLRGNMQGEYR